MKSWSETAKFVEKVYGSYVDWEEGFFDCPECGEPIYASDWEDMDFERCPICDFDFYDDTFTFTMDVDWKDKEE